MFARKSVLSLVLPLFINQALGQSGIQLDVNSQDSIKSAAKALSGSIISAYNENLKTDRIPGLFSDEYFFWEAGVVWNAMAEYSYLTGDSQYDETVSQALQFQVGDNNAYMPANQTRVLGNDDQSSWGLAAMTAAEVGLAKPKNAEWIDYAANVWNTQAQRLDAQENNGTCGGGLKWQIFTFNNGYTYKNALSNGNFFLLSARLAKFTGNTTYTHYANKVFKWSQNVGLVTNNFHVYDGTDDKTNCSSVSKFQWSANHGIYTEGAALMYNITAAQNWTDAVKGFVNSTFVFQSKNNSVIIESACEQIGKCDTDQRAFKGIFARTLARAALAAPIVAEPITKMLSISAKSAAAACVTGQDTACSLSWENPESKWTTASAKDGNLGEVFSALEIVQGLLYPSAKALNTAKGSGGVSGNGTQSGGASKSSGSGAPQQTGAAGSMAVSLAAVLAVAFAAALNC